MDRQYAHRELEVLPHHDGLSILLITVLLYIRVTRLANFGFQVWMCVNVMMCSGVRVLSDFSIRKAQFRVKNFNGKNRQCSIHTPIRIFQHTLYLNYMYTLRDVLEGLRTYLRSTIELIPFRPPPPFPPSPRSDSFSLSPFAVQVINHFLEFFLAIFRCAKGHAGNGF